jgi:hypothetical protein
VSYFSFDWDNAATEKLAIRREDLYNVIPSWRFIPGDFDNYLRGRGSQVFPISAIVRADNWKGVFYGMIPRTSDEILLEKPLEECEYNEGVKLIEHAKSRSMEQIAFSKEIATKRSDIHTDTYNTVVEIIQFLQKRGIRVIFVTPPYYHAYTAAYQRVNPEAISRMQENMAILQNENGVEYYDFSTDKEFVSDHTLFKDADHLNTCGASLFSAKLNEIVSDDRVSIEP